MQLQEQPAATGRPPGGTHMARGDGCHIHFLVVQGRDHGGGGGAAGELEPLPDNDLGAQGHREAHTCTRSVHMRM